jgi:head-tail adaptor
VSRIDAKVATDTANILLKYQTDIAKATREFAKERWPNRRQVDAGLIVPTESLAVTGEPFLDLLGGFIEFCGKRGCR